MEENRRKQLYGDTLFSDLNHPPSVASERDFLASQQTKANDFTFERFKPGESEIRTVGWPKPAPAQLPAAKEVERVVAEKTRKYRVDSYGQFSPVPKKDKSRKSGF